jgi:hypothetical protein
VIAVAVAALSWSHAICCSPPTATTRQNLPVCTDLRYIVSPGWMGALVPSGRNGMNCSGAVVPSPLLVQVSVEAGLATWQVLRPRIL